MCPTPEAPAWGCGGGGAGGMSLRRHRSGGAEGGGGSCGAKREHVQTGEADRFPRLCGPGALSALNQEPPKPTCLPAPRERQGEQPQQAQPECQWDRARACACHPKLRSTGTAGLGGTRYVHALLQPRAASGELVNDMRRIEQGDTRELTASSNSGQQRRTAGGRRRRERCPSPCILREWGG